MEVFRVHFQVPIMEPSQSHASRWKGDGGGGDLEEGSFTDNVVGCTGYCIDRMCLKLWSGDILSVKKAKKSIPLHSPPTAHPPTHCKGDCGAELNQILEGGPKLIYYNK